MATQQATFAGGCFWCTEAVFKDVIGVERGRERLYRRPVAEPDLQAGLRRRHRPCRGDPGHLDPTKRSAMTTCSTSSSPPTIRPSSTARATMSAPSIARPSSRIRPSRRKRRGAASSARQANWPEPIVTTIEPLGDWWPAEDYHQDYWEGEGQRNPYCLAVIPPKLQKLRKSFAARLKQAQTADERQARGAAARRRRSLIARAEAAVGDRRDRDARRGAGARLRGAVEQAGGGLDQIARRAEAGVAGARRRSRSAIRPASAVVGIEPERLGGRIMAGELAGRFDRRLRRSSVEAEVDRAGAQQAQPAVGDGDDRRIRGRGRSGRRRRSAGCGRRGWRGHARRGSG